MRIEEMDHNFIVNTDIEEPDIIWLDTRQAPFVTAGVTYDEEHGCYLRMPWEIANQVSQGVAHNNTYTAGGRLRFRTDSRFIGIHVVMDSNVQLPHITLVGQSGFDLYRKKDGEEKLIFCHSFIPPTGMRTGYTASWAAGDGLWDYTLNFPLFDGVKALYIALKKGAQLTEPAPYKYPGPIVYYGSSITHGGCASRPGNSYEAILSRRLDADYINLGFAGCCKAEDSMVQYLAELPMSIFVCDYDHNTPNPEYLRKTHMPLYRAVRGRQPVLPIVFVTAPDLYTKDASYLIRREIIRETYRTAVAEGDGNVYFIDGAELFGEEDWDACTVDGTHPNDLGFYRMARHMEQTLKPLLQG